MAASAVIIRVTKTKSSQYWFNSRPRLLDACCGQRARHACCLHAQWYCWSYSCSASHLAAAHALKCQITLLAVAQAQMPGISTAWHLTCCLPQTITQKHTAGTETNFATFKRFLRWTDDNTQSPFQQVCLYHQSQTGLHHQTVVPAADCCPCVQFC